MKICRGANCAIIPDYVASLPSVSPSVERKFSALQVDHASDAVNGAEKERRTSNVDCVGIGDGVGAIGKMCVYHTEAVLKLILLFLLFFRRSRCPRFCSPSLSTSQDPGYLSHQE